MTGISKAATDLSLNATWLAAATLALPYVAPSRRKGKRDHNPTYCGILIEKTNVRRLSRRTKTNTPGTKCRIDIDERLVLKLIMFQNPDVNAYFASDTAVGL